jgi:phosphatase NudJ
LNPTSRSSVLLDFGKKVVYSPYTRRRFEPSGLIGVYQWTVPDSQRTYLRFCFSGDVGDPEPDRTLDPDISATHWMTAAQIAGGELPTRSPLVLRCIDDVHDTRPLGLESLYALD